MLLRCYAKSQKFPESGIISGLLPAARAYRIKMLLSLPRLERLNGIMIITTTKADPDEQAFPNLLRQEFKVSEINKVWLADITYVRTNTNAKLVCRALTFAIAKERPAAGLIHHSDRGSRIPARHSGSYLKSTNFFAE